MVSKFQSGSIILLFNRFEFPEYLRKPKSGFVYLKKNCRHEHSWYGDCYYTNKSFVESDVTDKEDNSENNDKINADKNK